MLKSLLNRSKAGPLAALVPLAAAALVLLIIMGTLALSGCGRGGGAGAAGGMLVQKAVVTKGSLSGAAVASGRVEALHSASVVSKISGRVAEVMVDVGSEVAAGDLLVRLDAPELAALVELHEAQLDKARHSDPPVQRVQAELALANAEAAYRTAEADYQRSAALRDAGAIPPQQFEQAERLYLQAKAAYEAAREGLDILVRATIPQTLRQLEAQLNKARADYNNSLIRAPLDGVVTARHINPGELAGTTQPVLALVSLDPVVVQAGVDENQVNLLQAGQKLQVKVAAVRQELFTGTVSAVAAAVSPATRAYTVKVQLANAEHSLKPGMFAEVLLEGAAGGEGLLVPVAALFAEDGVSCVWVIEDGRASKREVIAGRSDGRQVMILSGLAGGEEVAVSGLEKLRDGAAVSAR